MEFGLVNCFIRFVVATSFIVLMFPCFGRSAEVPGFGRSFMAAVVGSHSHNFGAAVVAFAEFVGATAEAAASEESVGPSFAEITVER